MKKIAIIATNPKSLISFKGDLIKDLVKNKLQVFVLCSEYTEALKKDIKLLGGIPLDINFNRLGLNIINEFRVILNLIKVLKSISPEYILTYFAKSIVYGIFSGWLVGIKYKYAIIEGLGYAFTKDPNNFSLKKSILRIIISNLYRFSLSKATKVFLLNNDDLNDLLNFKIIKNNINSFVLGPIGINLDSYPYHEIDLSNQFTFLFIGRLIKEKGIIEYLKASEIINKKFPKTIFVVLGDIENKRNPGFLEYSYLNNLLSKKYIIWEKDVNVVKWINTCSSFVLPSYREGFPRSSQEAMAVGRSIITTNVPGCRETVIEGENGFIIPPGDITSLVECMEYLILNPKHNKIMGQKSNIIARSRFSNKLFNKRIIKHILD